MYNLMSGKGFVGGAYSDAWIHAWVSVAIIGLLCFFAWFLQKDDMIPFTFHFAGGLFGVLVAIGVIMFTGASKIALVAGLVCFIIGGYFVGSRQGG